MENNEIRNIELNKSIELLANNMEVVEYSVQNSIRILDSIKKFLKENQSN